MLMKSVFCAILLSLAACVSQSEFQSTTTNLEREIAHTKQYVYEQDQASVECGRALILIMQASAYCERGDYEQACRAQAVYNDYCGVNEKPLRRGVIEAMMNTLQNNTE